MMDPWIAQNDIPGEDWFAVSLTQDKLTTLQFTSMPQDLNLAAYRVAPDGTQTYFGSTGTGALKPFTFTAAFTGIYLFWFEPYPAANVDPFVMATKPHYLSEQYSFEITQAQ